MFPTVFRWLAVRPCRARIWLAKCPGSSRQSPNVTSRSSLFRPFSTPSTKPVATGQSGSDREIDPTKASDPKSVVYVANFPFWTEEQHLRERFEVFGPIAHVNIQKTGTGQSRGYGHILFTDPVDAATAIRSLNKDTMFIGERRIRARYPTSPSRTAQGKKTMANQLFIGNLPFVLEEHELRERLEVFGEISDIRIGYTSDGRARGFAHVDFVKPEDAITAYDSAKQEPIHIFGRDLRVDYPQLKVKPQRIYQVFVGNLPFMYETSLLREAFEKFGEVAKIRSGYDANGRALSYAHVEFRTQEAAEAAFSASSNKEIYLFDRHLRVEYAKYPQGVGDITALFYKDFRRGGEKGIREVFKDFESFIVGINCLRRRPDAKLTGQGFINFLTPEAAQEAFDALNGNVDFHIEFSCSKVPPDILKRRHPRDDATLLDENGT